MRLATACLVAVLALATPAHASTMPTLDMDRRTPLTFTGGFPDAGLDVAVTDSVSVGALASWFAGGAVRTTWRVAGAPDRPSWGLTLGGGYSWLDAWAPMGAPRPNLWVSPAVVGSLPLGAGPDARWWVILRGAAGPGLFTRLSGEPPGLLALLNGEIALAIRGQGELTLFGNGLAGWRARF